MRILLASSSSGSRGGGEIFLQYLGQGLAHRGHEVIFWCADHPRMDELAAGLSAIGKVIRAPYRNFYDHRTRILATSANFSTSRRIAAEWSALDPDVVHVNKQNLEDGLDLLRAANLARRKTVCTIHITQTARFLGARVAWVRDFLSRRGLRKYHGPYVAVQETRRKELAAFLANGNQTHTILNGVPVPIDKRAGNVRESKRRELKISDTERLVIGVGRMEAQKQPLRFLEVAERIARVVPSARFLWIGGGSLASAWDQRVAERRLGNSVRRLEWQADVKPYLHAADLLLHTAAYEGLPFALIEAMAAGLPCAIPKDLAGEINLFSAENVFFTEDEASLARTLQNPAELAIKAENAHRLAEEHFSLEKMARDYEALYQERGERRAEKGGPVINTEDL
jgi:glycosyltransferase involved in cell wall biosynthesis